MPEPWKDEPDPRDEALANMRAVSEQLRQLTGTRSPEQQEADRLLRERATIDGELHYPRLPRYRRRRRCPKCHARAASSQFVDPALLAPGHFLPIRYYRECGTRSVMLRHCTTCHYEWFERPLDVR